MMSDETLMSNLRNELFTAVVGDILDRMGYRRQFLPAEIKPLTPGTKLVGRAMPVLVADVYDEISDTSRGPFNKQFGIMLEALDDMKAGEVYVATGASRKYALWGEIMSTRAKQLKVAGTIVDGYLRDAGGIGGMGFPAFSRGVYAQDISCRGKVIDFRTPIEIGDVRIVPGDLIFGDGEGVLVIPASVEKEVVDAAMEKARTESRVVVAIRGGMSAREAFDKFGVM
jgi:regulator of RNase E activity RraA